MQMISSVNTLVGPSPLRPLLACTIAMGCLASLSSTRAPIQEPTIVDGANGLYVVHGEGDHLHVTAYGDDAVRRWDREIDRAPARIDRAMRSGDGLSLVWAEDTALRLLQLDRLGEVERRGYLERFAGQLCMGAISAPNRWGVAWYSAMGLEVKLSDREDPVQIPISARDLTRCALAGDDRLLVIATQSPVATTVSWILGPGFIRSVRFPVALSIQGLGCNGDGCAVVFAGADRLVVHWIGSGAEPGWVKELSGWDGRQPAVAAGPHGIAIAFGEHDYNYVRAALAIAGPHELTSAWTGPDEPELLNVSPSVVWRRDRFYVAHRHWRDGKTELSVSEAR